MSAVKRNALPCARGGDIHQREGLDAGMAESEQGREVRYEKHVRFLIDLDGTGLAHPFPGQQLRSS